MTGRIVIGHRYNINGTNTIYDTAYKHSNGDTVWCVVLRSLAGIEIKFSAQIYIYLLVHTSLLEEWVLIFCPNVFLKSHAVRVDSFDAPPSLDLGENTSLHMFLQIKLCNQKMGEP